MIIKRRKNDSVHAPTNISTIENKTNLSNKDFKGFVSWSNKEIHPSTIHVMIERVIQRCQTNQTMIKQIHTSDKPPRDNWSNIIISLVNSSICIAQSIRHHVNDMCVRNLRFVAIERLNYRSFSNSIEWWMRETISPGVITSSVTHLTIGDDFIQPISSFSSRLPWSI